MRSARALQWLPACVLVAAATACGGNTSVQSQARSGHTPSASPAASSLMVIVSPDTSSSMSVRLVNAKGAVTALTQFNPPQQPTLANCADLLQPPVRVAAGAVYFADSQGSVRRLAHDGSVSGIATFALTSKQQLLSFAVSPDGAQLIAIVISTPPLHSPPPQQLGDPVFAPGTWTLDLETATPGGATNRPLHRDLGSTFPTPTVITGWDVFGPTATLNSQLCTQAALASAWYNGMLIHLAMDGTHLDRIGGLDCVAWDELADGTVLCGSSGDSQAFSVRHADGTVLWSGTSANPFGAHLSTDGNGVAFGDGSVYLRSAVQPLRFAASTPFKGEVLGWMDARDVLLEQNGHIGVTASVAPLVFKDLGLTLTGQCLECIPYGVMFLGTIPSA